MNFSILNKFRKLNNKLNYAENNGISSNSNKIDLFLVVKTFIINMAYPTPPTNNLSSFLSKFAILHQNS